MHHSVALASWFAGSCNCYTSGETYGFPSTRKSTHYVRAKMKENIVITLAFTQANDIHIDTNDDYCKSNTYRVWNKLSAIVRPVSP